MKKKIIEKKQGTDIIGASAAREFCKGWLQWFSLTSPFPSGRLSRFCWLLKVEFFLKYGLFFCSEVALHL